MRRIEGVWAWVLVLAICAVALTLRAVPLMHPVLLHDDFDLLSQSYTWDLTQENLLRPHSVHVIPLSRMWSWVIVQVAGRPTLLPTVAAWQGPVALTLALLLLFVFVKRETGQAFYGLVGVALFGISTQYLEVVFWFSSGLSLLMLVTLLIALLAAQRWRQTGRWPWLAACAVLTALAPGWFASGMLAGPLCCLYLLPREQGPGQASNHRRWFRHLLLALVPALGTAAFVGLGLGRNFSTLYHLEPRPLIQGTVTVQPLAGVEFTLRSLVDNLLLGNLGIHGYTLPGGLAIALAAALLAVGAWWVWTAPARRLAMLGAGMVLCSYFFIYSSRATLGYEFVIAAGRYHLLAQLGLAQFIAGGLPRWRFIRDLAETGGRQAELLLAGLVILLFCLQARHGAVFYNLPEQVKDLQRIEAVDALCRQNGISANAAREVLPRLQITEAGAWPDGTPRINGWDFLRGSPAPQPIQPEQIRRLLAPAATPPMRLATPRVPPGPVLQPFVSYALPTSASGRGVPTTQPLGLPI